MNERNHWTAKELEKAKEYEKLNPKQQEEHHLKIRKQLIKDGLLIPSED